MTDLVDAPPPGGVPTGRVAAVDWLIVVGLCLLGAFGALLGFGYLPLTVRWPGTATVVELPVGVLLPVLLAVLLPWLAFRLTGSLLAALAPVLAIFIVLVTLLLAPNALYGYPLRVVNIDPVTRVAKDNDWRNLLLLGATALAAAVCLSVLWATRTARRAGAAPGPPASDTADVAGAPDVPGAPEHSGHPDVTQVTEDGLRAPAPSAAGDTGERSTAGPPSDH